MKGFGSYSSTRKILEVFLLRERFGSFFFQKELWEVFFYILSLLI